MVMDSDRINGFVDTDVTLIHAVIVKPWRKEKMK